MEHRKLGSTGTAVSPLDGGFLTEKYNRAEDEPGDCRGDRHDGFLDGRNRDALEVVQNVADELDATPPRSRFAGRSTTDT